jgi:hypothetical protein
MENNGGSANLKANQITVNNSLFQYNYANRGGAIYLIPTGSSAKIKIHLTTFSDVQTGTSTKVMGVGGAIYVDGSNS